MTTHPAGRAILHEANINGFDYVGIEGVRFHVESIQIFEDHCKPYFTAQMIIETYDHAHEAFIFPTAEVFISFECPSSDPSFVSHRYSERFRIFSHDSEQISSGQQKNRLRHKLSLIGQEFYNDRHNNVIRSDNLKTGTAAASSIHEKIIRPVDGGGMRVYESSGIIGSKEIPHQTTNMKPFTAINNILSRCVWNRYPSCAPVYFKNKYGYVMGPLQGVMESASPRYSFTEYSTAGNSWGRNFLGTAAGYTQIKELKPLSPSGEASSGVRASEIGNLNKASAWIDVLTGTYDLGKLTGDGISKIMKKLNLQTNSPGVNEKIRAMLAEAQKGRNGGLQYNFIDSLMQDRATSKHGPGGFNVSQEAFVTALTYTDKYWVSVPGQGGHKVTCGDKITITYPIVRNFKTTNRTKTLYVARLVHNVRFTEGSSRKPIGDNATTDIYGVVWG